VSIRAPFGISGQVGVLAGVLDGLVLPRQLASQEHPEQRNQHRGGSRASSRYQVASRSTPCFAWLSRSSTTLTFFG
jgi:hypothetical protein